MCDRRETMRRLAALFVGATLVLGAVALAHEVTFVGTVVALKTSRYAQPGGGFREAQELEVTIVDEKTKKPANRVFTIASDTVVMRAKKTVPLAQAAIRQGERVEVVVDHDEPGDVAIEVRLR
jgi:hypothetical protein